MKFLTPQTLLKVFSLIYLETKSDLNICKIIYSLYKYKWICFGGPAPTPKL